jgi:hypothetical protein
MWWDDWLRPEACLEALKVRIAGNNVQPGTG